MPGFTCGRELLRDDGGPGLELCDTFFNNLTVLCPTEL